MENGLESVDNKINEVSTEDVSNTKVIDDVSSVTDKNKGDKKKNKKLVIVILIVLFLVLIGTGLLLYFLVFKKEQISEPAIVLEYGPVNYYKLENTTILSYSHDIFAIRDEENNSKLIYKDGKEFADLGKEKVSFISYIEGYYKVWTGEKNILFDGEGKKVKEHKDFIDIFSDSVTNEKYFLMPKNGKAELYNGNFELITKTDAYAIDAISNGIAYYDGVIYDLKNKKKIGSYEEEYYSGETYRIYYNKKNGYTVLNVKNGEEKKFKNMTEKYDKYIFSNGEDKYVLDYVGNEIAYDDIKYKKVENGYYMDYEGCKEGAKLKDKDGNIVQEECYYDYDLTYIDKGLYVATLYENDFESMRKIFTKDKEIDVVFSYGMLGDEYIFAYNEEENFTVYDLEGNEIESKWFDDVYEVTRFKDKKYLISNPQDFFIVDENLDKAIAHYDFVQCNEKEICIIDNDNKKGIYYKGEELITPSYIDGFMGETSDYVYFNGLTYSIIVEYGEGTEFINKDDLVYNNDFSKYVVNKDEIIKKYKLENIKDVIDENEEFFQKYAYIIENNNMLGKYKKQVYDILPTVIEGKHYMDEDIFLSSLQRLSIELVKEISVEGAVGLYADGDKEITMLDDAPRIIYHELMHFMDFSLGISHRHTNYLCDDKIYSIDEYNKLENRDDCSYAYYPYTQLITEAGAEVFMANQFNYGIPIVYYDPVLIYQTLSYIYGSKVINNIYYNPDSDYELWRLIVLDSGLSVDKYNEMIDAFSAVTALSNNDLGSSYMKIVDSLIELYKLEFPDKEWYEDKEFVYLISLLANKTYLINSSKYKDHLEIFSYYGGSVSRIDHEIGSYIFDQENGTDYGVNFGNGMIIYQEDSSFYYLTGSYKGTYGFFIVDYDFEQGKVNNFKFIEDKVSSN